MQIEYFCSKILAETIDKRNLTTPKPCYDPSAKTLPSFVNNLRHKFSLKQKESIRIPSNNVIKGVDLDATIIHEHELLIQNVLMINIKEQRPHLLKSILIVHILRADCLCSRTPWGVSQTLPKPLLDRTNHLSPLHSFDCNQCSMDSTQTHKNNETIQKINFKLDFYEKNLLDQRCISENDSVTLHKLPKPLIEKYLNEISTFREVFVYSILCAIYLVQLGCKTKETTHTENFKNSKQSLS